MGQGASDTPGDHVRRAAGALGRCITLDEIARVSLDAALGLPGALRTGLALNRTGGRQLQFVSSDRVEPASAVRWCLIDAYDNVPLNEAVRTGADVYLPSLVELDASYPEIAPRQRSLGTCSMAAVALTTGSECVGGLMIAFDHEQPFDSETRLVLQSLAAQVTQALLRETTQHLMHTTSEQLQRSLMAPSLPELAGLTINSHYQPGGLNADVGGDWYDVIELPDGSVVVALGDVMGKGVPATIVMGEIRSALRAYTIIDAAPSAVLSLLDAFVSSHTEREQLVTLAYGVLSPDRTHLTIATAGHPPPLLVDATQTLQLTECAGPALGFDAGPWDDITVPLEPMSTLLLYSDGLVESRDRDLFSGIDQLVASVAALPARRRLPRELCTELRDAMSHGENDDDITMLAVGVVPVDSLQKASTSLPADTTAPGIGRRFVRSTLADWGRSELVDTATLCTSELVTNAIIHSGTSPELTVQLSGGYLSVVVHDHGGRGEVARGEDQEPMRVSGRGLSLVEALASSWNAEHGPDGTTVWFELEVDDTDVPVEQS